MSLSQQGTLLACFCSHTGPAGLQPCPKGGSESDGFQDGRARGMPGPSSLHVVTCSVGEHARSLVCSLSLINAYALPGRSPRDYMCVSFPKVQARLGRARKNLHAHLPEHDTQVPGSCATCLATQSLAVGFQCYTISIILHTLLWAPFHRSLRSGHTPYCTDLREQNPQWKDNCVPGSNVTVKNAKVSP